MHELGVKGWISSRFSLTVELILVMLCLLFGGLAVSTYSTQKVVLRMEQELQKNSQEFAEQILEETETALRLQGELHAKQVVLDKSQHLNEVFAGVERIVGVQTAFAERLLNEEGPTSSFPIYANEDFAESEKRPLDFGAEPGKNRNVSLSAAVYKLAPGVRYDEVKRTLERYRALAVLFREHYRANPRTHWLYIGTSSGVYLGYPADGGLDPSFDPRVRPWYRRAVRNKGMVWSQPYQDVAGGRLVTCSRPVYRSAEKKEIVGVVAVDMTVGELGRLANEIEAGLSGGAFLLDRTGQVIARPRIAGSQDTILRNAKNLLKEDHGDLSKVASEMVKGASGLTRIVQDDKEDYIAYAPIPTTGWSLGVIIPLDQVLRLSKQHRSQLQNQISEAKAKTTDQVRQLQVTLWSTNVMMVLILIGLFAAGAYVRLTKPIQDVISDLNTIRKGNLDHRVEVSGAADFVKLSAAINQMTWHLKKSREAIEEHSRTLEKKVTERTKELAKKNLDLGKALSQVKDAQGLLVQSEKMASLGQLVAGIAHEINNPVNFISNSVGPIQSALEELDSRLKTIISDDKYQEKADIQELLDSMRKATKLIETGASRTKQIVLNLRNFSRLDEAERKSVDIHEGIDGSLSLLNYKFKKGVSIQKKYGDIGLVECYPGQLNQVFMNVLSNAVQAVDGDGEIEIMTGREDGTVKISIRDTGSGIPPEKIGHIFDPFFTTKPVGEGTGLGLSISHGIIEKHGGTIEVESELGVGTTFVITIPVVASS